MKILLSAIFIILWNLLLAYLISFFSLNLALVCFGLGVGFQFGKWYGQDKKENDFIGREEAIRSEYEKE